MNSPPKFAIPRFDVHQSSRVQHLCFLSSTFSRATIGVVVQVSRAHFLTPPPVTDLFCYIWDTQQKNIDLNWTRFSREKWRINWKTIERFWTRMREIWCKFGQFLASNFLKAAPPRESTGRERTRDICLVTEFPLLLLKSTSVRDLIIYTHASQNADDDDDDEHFRSARCVVVFVLLLVVIIFEC